MKTYKDQGQDKTRQDQNKKPQFQTGQEKKHTATPGQDQHGKNFKKETPTKMNAPKDKNW